MNVFSISKKPEIILDFNVDEYNFKDFKETLDSTNNSKIRREGELKLTDIYEELGLHVPSMDRDYYETHLWKDGKFGHYETLILFRKKIFGLTITKEKTVFIEDGWGHK